MLSAGHASNGGEKKKIAFISEIFGQSLETPRSSRPGKHRGENETDFIAEPQNHHIFFPVAGESCTNTSVFMGLALRRFHVKNKMCISGFATPCMNKMLLNL